MGGGAIREWASPRTRCTGAPCGCPPRNPQNGGEKGAPIPLPPGRHTKKGGRFFRIAPPEDGGLLLSRFPSTIGAGGLNFSVRNGKRWIPAAITTCMVCMHIAHADIFSKKDEGRTTEKDSRAISTARLWCRHLYTCGLSTSCSATTLKGGLILWMASRLDAFSAYPTPT